MHHSFVSFNFLLYFDLMEGFPTGEDVLSSLSDSVKYFTCKIGVIMYLLRLPVMHLYNSAE